MLVPEKYFQCFLTYGHGGHLGHVSQIPPKEHLFPRFVYAPNVIWIQFVAPLGQAGLEKMVIDVHSAQGQGQTP